MKKKLYFAFTGLLILALLLWAFLPSPKEVEVATVTQGRFERAIQEDGKTRVRERYVVSAPITGRIARTPLKPGDTVGPNSTLGVIWPPSPTLLDERTRAEQQAHTAAMLAAQEKALANVARATAALEQSMAELKRSEALALQGFISPNQNETNRVSVRLREKELESSRHEAVAARFAYEQSRQAVRQFLQSTSVTRQQGFEIKAPVGAKVLKIFQSSEGLVMVGSPVMELGDPSQLEVVADILTEDAAQIRPGTPVQLSNWGGPDVLLGAVRLVEPAAFTKVSALGVEEQRVNAIIDITSHKDKWLTLNDGFKVDVRVLVQTEENAVIVPVSAIFPMGSRSGVFVLAGGRANLREIEVTARNGKEAWVRTGLPTGTQVLVYPDTKLKDKDRVKPR